MTLATDYRVACRGEVRFGLTGVRVGIPYPAAAMTIINAELAPADRRYMLLGARTMAAAEAVARGIVDELQPSERVLDRSLEVARDLATTPQASYASTKLQIRRDAIARLHTHLTEDPSLDSWLPPQ
jgi:enoyl-CoA hydratase